MSVDDNQGGTPMLRPTDSPAGQSGAAPSTGSVPVRSSLRTGAIPTNPGQPPRTGTQPPAGSSPFGAVQPPTIAPGTSPTPQVNRTATGAIPTSAKDAPPRKARVMVSTVDPWSVLKIAFLLSFALGIMTVIATFIVWNVLNSMGLFAVANEWVARLFSEDTELDLLQFFDRDKWMSAAMLVATINVVLSSALATVGAFLYNVISGIVGGLYVTLTDD